MVAMLYAWFYQEILGYLLSLSGDRPLSEDITQDTFLRALRNPAGHGETSLPRLAVQNSAQPVHRQDAQEKAGKRLPAFR